MGRHLFIYSNSKEWKVEIEEKGRDKCHVKIGEKMMEIELMEVSGGLYHLIVNGKPLSLQVSRVKDGMEVLTKEGKFSFSIFPVPLSMMKEKGSTEKKFVNIVKSPMPGRVVKIYVKEGDLVEKNSVLLTLEAMKMENEIRSPVKGIVKKMYVKNQTAVEGKVPLVEIEVVD